MFVLLNLRITPKKRLPCAAEARKGMGTVSTTTTEITVAKVPHIVTRRRFYMRFLI